MSKSLSNGMRKTLLITGVLAAFASSPLLGAPGPAPSGLVPESGGTAAPEAIPDSNLAAQIQTDFSFREDLTRADRLESSADSQPHHGSGSAHGEGGHGRHHVSLFVGSTRKEGENEATVGLDYEYRWTRVVGIGGLVDHAGGHFDTTIVAASLVFHVASRLKLVLAPGIERHHGEEEGLLRLGMMYDFDLGKLSLSPTVYLDLVDGEEAWVFGLSIGRSLGKSHE